MRDRSHEGCPVQKYFDFIKYLDNDNDDNKSKVLAKQNGMSDHAWIFDQEYVLAAYQIKHNLKILFNKIIHKGRISVISRQKNYLSIKNEHYRLYRLLGIETRLEKKTEEAPRLTFYLRARI